MRLLAPLLVGLALAALGAGCGGDSGDEARTISTSSLTAAEFAERAEAICTRSRIEALRYRGPGKAGQSEKEAVAEEIRVTLLPAIQKAIDQIYALGAPPGEAEEVEAFLVPLQEGVSAGGELRAPSLERIDRLLEPAGIRAKRYGLEACVFG